MAYYINLSTGKIDIPAWEATGAFSIAFKARYTAAISSADLTSAQSASTENYFGQVFGFFAVRIADNYYPTTYAVAANELVEGTIVRDASDNVTVTLNGSVQPSFVAAGTYNLDTLGYNFGFVGNSDIYYVNLHNGTDIRTYTPDGVGVTDTTSAQNGVLSGGYTFTFYVATTSITINTTEAYIQRVGSNVVRVTSGTYEGAPTSIRRKVIYSDDNSIVTGYDWATFIASPSGGVFSGNITAPENTSGRSYKVVLDFSNDALITVTSAEYEAADKWLIWGQSLAEFMQTNGSDVSPLSGVFYANSTNGALSIPVAGNAQTTLLNALKASTNMPQIAINPATGGTALLQVNDGGNGYLYNPITPNSSRYVNTLTAINALGGDFAGAIFIQGEQDGQAGNSLETYADSLTAHFAQVRSDTRADLPIYVAVLGSIDSGATDENWNIVQQAQIAVSNTDVNSFYIAKNDLARVDLVHLTPASNTILGSRLANAIIANNFGGLIDWKPPFVTSFERVSTTQTRVNIAQGQGTDFTPIGVNAITGAELTEVGDTYAVIITDATKETPSSFILTHAASTITSGRYAYGINPNLTGVVLDNSALNLPLISSGIMALGVSLSSIFNPLLIGVTNGSYVTVLDKGDGTRLSRQARTITNNRFDPSITVAGEAPGLKIKGYFDDNLVDSVNGVYVEGVTE